MLRHNLSPIYNLLWFTRVIINYLCYPRILANCLLGLVDGMWLGLSWKWPCELYLPSCDGLKFDDCGFIRQNSFEMAVLTVYIIRS